MRRNWITACVAILFLLATACRRAAQPEMPDRPRLTPTVEMQDVTFHSAALNREATYRVILPKSIVPGHRLPVLYLLHGGGGGFRDWSNNSDVPSTAATWELILVMPEGHDSYYMNAVANPQDRYEDFVVHDLIADVEARFLAAPGREHRAIAGVSMGGFGAVVLSLRHPELFAFAGGLSPALDVPERRFSMKRWGQWSHHHEIFGPMDGEVRRSEDPYLIAKNSESAAAPYFFLTCGAKEGLLPANERFASLLRRRHFAFEYHAAPGAGHDWNNWNAQVPGMIEALSRKIQ